MEPRDKRTIRLGGHEVTVVVGPGEDRILELARMRVNELVDDLQGRSSGLVPTQKLALMAAFQCAFDAVQLDIQLEASRRAEAELAETKEALARLEKLLGKVDDALAY
ncbi:MAG: cell division protein ZapA [Candidatus Sumerlaeia bacterium]|nr:cell division protein ZapA [Candidatus Sumerlaeia bacterium]